MTSLEPDFGEIEADECHYQGLVYQEVTSESELSTRPRTAGVVTGQASFLALAIRLQVPILDYATNQRGGTDQFSAGFGASYDVSRSFFPLGRDGRTPAITNPHRLWFGGRVNESLVSVGRFVAKKIRTNTNSAASDAVHLAAITNEMRILSSKFLREGNFNVRLLCLAWDSTPSFGRYWPRLLLECADFGNLHDYLRLSPGGNQWAEKISLALDVLCGLKELHYHSVVHGDLRLENVVVFAETSTADSNVRVKAKLCDFGVSIIMSDYDKEATFQDRLGTPPWNAPELAYGLPVSLSKLPAADMYSFGLLLSRICLNGGSPFEGLNSPEIDNLKSFEADAMSMHGKIIQSFTQSRCLKEHQRDAIGLIMLLTLSHDIAARAPTHTISALLCVFMILYSDAHCDYLESANLETEAHDSEATQGTAEPTRTQPSTQRNQTLSFSSWLTSFQTFFGSPVQHGLEFLVQRPMIQRIRDSLQNFISSYKWFTTPVIQALLRRTGLFKDRYDELLRPSPVAVLPISSLIEDSDRVDSFYLAQLHVPDFEDWSSCQFSTLHINVLCETINDLTTLAAAESPKYVAGVAAYQLAVANFYGFGVERNITNSLDLLLKAAQFGHPNVLCSGKNVYEAISRSIPDSFPSLPPDHLERLVLEEITFSMIQILKNNLEPRDQFPALRWWTETDSEKCKLFLNSSSVKHHKMLFFRVWSIMNLTENTGDFQEYHFLKQINHHSLMVEAPFQLEDREAFVAQMRLNNCTEKIEHGLTMLQYASAKGDFGLVQTLVQDLHAKVDSAGRTPGLTPLLIAALCGHFEILKILLQNGADIRRRDSHASRNVLHFLNQFPDQESINWILLRAADAAMDIEGEESLDSSLRNPLLSTFIGWDFSGSQAALQLLHSWNADPMRISKTGSSPMQMCARVIDTRLLRAMLVSNRERSQGADNTSLTVEQKLGTFQYLLSLRLMFLFRLLGRCWRERLRDFICQLDIDSVGVLGAYASSKYTPGSNPLIGACWDSNSYLLEILLEMDLPVSVNNQNSYGSTPLHWAIERRNRECIALLLKRNASLTILDENGFNVAHVAAIHFPSILPELAEIYTDSYGPPSDLLEVQDALGFTPYALAVVEGSYSHLQNAEQIRTKYDLRYDDFCVRSGKDGKMTLLGWITLACSSSSNMVHPRQVSYLLGLEPKPKFVCTTQGLSLLHLMARGYSNALRSDNLIAYDVFDKILTAFPGPAQVNLRDQENHTALHFASSSTDIPIVEIIRDHMSQNRDSLEVNSRSQGGTTPLEYVGAAQRSLGFDRTRDKPIFDGIQAKTYDMYRLLRSMGALNGTELQGIVCFYAARMQNEMNKQELLSFLRQIERRYGVTSLFFDGPTRSNTSHVIAEFAESKSGGIPSHLIGTREVSWIVCLSWMYDRFVMNAFQLKKGDIDLVKNVLMGYRAKALDKSGFSDRGMYPWMTTKCYDTFEGRSFEWTRPGRVWTAEERKELCAKIGQDWEDTFQNPDHTFEESRYVDRPRV